MIIEQTVRYYVQYHDPATYRRLQRLGTDWYWLDFHGGPDGGRWLTGREARDAFCAVGKYRGMKFRVVKQTVTDETVIDLE